MKNLNLRAQILIIITILLGVLVSIHYLSNLKSQDIIWLLILAGLTAVTQVFKVEGATEKSSYNLSWVLYGFTFLLLGAPATLFIILISHIVEWIFHKYPWYIQTYNIATYALAVTIAELVYKAFNPAQAQFTIAFAIGLLAALLSFTLTNHFLVGLVIWFARGQNFKEFRCFWFPYIDDRFYPHVFGVSCRHHLGNKSLCSFIYFRPYFFGSKWNTNASFTKADRNRPENKFI